MTTEELGEKWMESGRSLKGIETLRYESKKDQGRRNEIEKAGR